MSFTHYFIKNGATRVQKPLSLPKRRHRRVQLLHFVLEHKVGGLRVLLKDAPRAGRQEI